MKELLEQTIVEKHQLAQQQRLLVGIVSLMLNDIGVEEWGSMLSDVEAAAEVNISVEQGEVLVTA